MGWRVGKVWFLIGLQPWPVANPEVGGSVPLPLWGNSVVLASPSDGRRQILHLKGDVFPTVSGDEP